MVEIKPGFDEKTVLTVKGKGNEQFGQARGHVKITLCQDDSASNMPQNFLRRGNDLIFIHSCTLENALMSTPFSLVTLD